MQRGEGVEVTGVHPYARGGRKRRSHWPATIRRGSVQVHQFAAERAADTVVLLDVLADVVAPVTARPRSTRPSGPPPGLLRACLRSHDRGGVVSVGGTTHWLRPGGGQRYFYGIVERVLEARKNRAHRTEGIGLFPPPALPEGALVCVMTPSTDLRIVDVLHQVRGRANPMVVVAIPAHAGRGNLVVAAARLARRRGDRGAPAACAVRPATPARLTAWITSGPGARCQVTTFQRGSAGRYRSNPDGSGLYSSVTVRS